MDAIGISAGSARLQGSAQADYQSSQVLAIGSGVTKTSPFLTGASVVTLRATVNCWYSVGATAAAHVAGSDYLPANATFMLKIPQGATISVIQDSVAGYLAVTPMVNPSFGVSSAPAFDWDFTTGALPGGMTWVRAGATASYFNSAGVLVTGVAASTPRFDYDPVSLLPKGVLVEAASTNSCLYNRDLTQAPWVKTNATAALTQTGLTGVASSASLLTASAANGTALQTITIASAAYFLSAYVKRVTGSGVVQMTMDGGTTWTNISVTSTTTWTRVSIPTQTLANPVVGFRLATSGDAIAVDCVQLEALTFATSPIVTTTAAVTRNMDTGTLTPIAWYNATQGTFLGQFDCGLVPSGVNQSALRLDDSSLNNAFLLRAISNWDAVISVAGSTVYQTTGPVAKVPGSGPLKDAVVYYQVGVSAAAGGSLLTTSSAPLVATPTGINRLVLLGGNVWVRRVTYWSQALNNTQLAVVTT